MKVEVKQGQGSSTLHDHHLSPAKDICYTVNQQLQIASMAQSKRVIDSRELTELSDRIVTRATNKVAGVNALIDGLKFEITNTSSDDPDRVQLMKKLRVLHQDLATALDELLLAEQSIIDAAASTLQLKAEAAREKTSQKTLRRSKQGSID